MERSAALIHAPGINLMYGDNEGNILVGQRQASHSTRPCGHQTAIDGTDPANEVQGWHPFAMNPQSVNPPAGYVYSANNAPDSVKGVYHPGHYYSGNTRGRASSRPSKPRTTGRSPKPKNCSSTTIRSCTGRTAR